MGVVVIEVLTYGAESLVQANLLKLVAGDLVEVDIVGTCSLGSLTSPTAE
jgi:hypothetical protein